MEVRFFNTFGVDINMTSKCLNEITGQTVMKFIHEWISGVYMNKTFIMTCNVDSEDDALKFCSSSFVTDPSVLVTIQQDGRTC